MSTTENEAEITNYEKMRITELKGVENETEQKISDFRNSQQQKFSVKVT
jgi:hypothetical protein